MTFRTSYFVTLALRILKLGIWLTAQGISMYVYKIRVKKNRKFFEIPAALFFLSCKQKNQKKWV